MGHIKSHYTRTADDKSAWSRENEIADFTLVMGGKQQEEQQSPILKLVCQDITIKSCVVGCRAICELTSCRCYPQVVSAILCVCF